MRGRKGFGISEDDLKYIYGEDYRIFCDKIIHNVWCGRCKKGSATIKDYSIEINDLNDLLLRGKCAKCGHYVARYVETGESSKYLGKIENVRNRN